MEQIIECVYKGGVLIPTEKLEIPESSRVILKIEGIKTLNDLKLLSYIKLLREGEDAEELFEF
jgi:predicted DNA-binding antitoxin AbrB/MazE fold protein